jgi:2-dehydro-3-deoxyphosphooctonate aldolase (KDO 8-P synthase)
MVNVGGHELGGKAPLFFIGGPDVIEGEAHALRHARAIAAICREIGMAYIFKSSYDKANRTSLKSFRGVGLKAGLKILSRIRSTVKVPVLTDVHSPEEAKQAAKSVDVLQIPAFLSRQTDLLLAAGRTKRAIHIKKGQFLAPWDMKNVIAKVASTGNRSILVAERGTTFGYNTLVVDMRSIPIMQGFGYPVVMDAGHSVQAPSGAGHVSGGDRAMIPILARAGVAAGADGVFMEVHEDPDHAPCDGPNSLNLSDLEDLLFKLVLVSLATGRKAPVPVHG